MKIFRSLHLQKHLGDVQEAVRQGPVLFMHYGQPKSVMMSVDEFRRLKEEAGEAVPAEITSRRAVTQEGLPPDALGYDTTNLFACAIEMAAAAKSGRNREAVREEIARTERRLGFAG
jgi:PHD/YefM family antitoxin component YafN of YafNO toxin-antitoxin module